MGNQQRAAVAGEGVGFGEGGDALSALAAAEDAEGMGFGAEGERSGQGVGEGEGGAPSDAAPPTPTDTDTADEPLTLEVQNAQPNPGGATTRTTVGVGEITYVYPNLDGGDWSASSGTGAVEGDGTYTWTAPETAGSATVTCTVGDQSTSITFTVLAPTSVAGSRIDDIGHPAGVHGAGMTLTLTYGPASVSFANLGWLEEQGAIGASGIFEGRALPITHNPAWQLMGGQNDIHDTADHHSFPRPWGQGTMTYTIHQKYRTEGGGPHAIADVVQTHTMTGEDGTSQTSKAGASSSARTP